MYEASAWLIRKQAERYSIPLDRNHVICHREIRGTKTCPGSKVDLDKLIRLAGAIDKRDIPSDERPAANITVTTIKNANLQARQPSTSAAIVRTIARGTTLKMVTATDGEAVQGNPKWYQDRDGNFLWAGVTKQL